jgi:chromosome segregation ATPase
MDDNVKDATLRILQNIQSQMGELRAELGDVRTRIDRLESNMAVQFDEVRSDLKGDMASVRAELKAEIRDTRTELRGEIESLRDELRVGFKAT